MITDTSDGLPGRVLRDLLSSAIVAPRLDGIEEGSEDSPFALWIIEKLKPKVYVQLGLDDGDVYSAFCPAAEIGLRSGEHHEVERAQAEDHHALPDKTGYRELERHHNQQSDRPSQLIHSSFEKALADLPDKSIDLLQLHGQCDTTARSGCGLELWWSKLSDRAVVLLPSMGPGEEPEAYSQWLLGLPRGASDQISFFDSGYGIGMLSVGREVPDVIQELTHLQGDDVALVQLAFQSFGRLLASQLSESMLRREANKAVEALLLESSKLDSAREQLWTAEIEKRKLEVESCRAEVHLAERVAILRHTDAEKDRLIGGLQNKKQAMGGEIAELRHELSELRRVHDMVMNSRSMAITWPMRALIDIVRRVLR